MAPVGIVESQVEEAMLGWLDELGYQIAHGPDVEPEKLAAERDDFTEVVLSRRLRAALERINPGLPASAIDDALRKVLVVESPSLVENNRRFHRMLVDGIDVEYHGPTARSPATRSGSWTSTTPTTTTGWRSTSSP